MTDIESESYDPWKDDRPIYGGRTYRDHQLRLKRIQLRWGIGPKEQLETLCASLPSMHGKPGTSPWDRELFVRWACDPDKTDIERYTAGFVLLVCESGDWMETAVEEVGLTLRGAEFPFDVVAAATEWDDAHIAALMEFLREPFRAGEDDGDWLPDERPDDWHERIDRTQTEGYWAERFGDS